MTLVATHLWVCEWTDKNGSTVGRAVFEDKRLADVKRVSMETLSFKVYVWEL